MNASRLAGRSARGCRRLRTNGAGRRFAVGPGPIRVAVALEEATAGARTAGEAAVAPVTSGRLGPTSSRRALSRSHGWISRGGACPGDERRSARSPSQREPRGFRRDGRVRRSRRRERAGQQRIDILKPRKCLHPAAPFRRLRSSGLLSSRVGSDGLRLVPRNSLGSVASSTPRREQCSSTNAFMT